MQVSANTTTDEIKEKLSSYFQQKSLPASVYVIGSLAHGGFAPLVSDIDIAIVFDQINQETAAGIEQIETECQQMFSQVVSIFWGDADHINSQQPGYRFPPIDLLDLHSSGALIYGAECREQLQSPTTHSVLIDSITFIIGKLSEPVILSALQTPEQLIALGPRLYTKISLMPARLFYTLKTGKITNIAATVSYTLDHYPEYSELLNHMLAWRLTPPSPSQVAIDLVNAHLIRLYQLVMQQYCDELTQLKQTQLVDQIQQWCDNL